ncbi:KH domain-containing protein akap-1 [Euwallacea similis]|uniref:KH domain-containing protein akap-1 n=1 Tax=Euwallacea similis TaxID=1736056 RepID=UPI00344C019C
MAPSPIRQLLAWSLPSVAVLLSYLWYKKRRIGAPSDTGGSKPIEEEEYVEKHVGPAEGSELLDLSIPRENSILHQNSPVTTPTKFNRSLSGVDTAPIDIVYPRDLKSSKSSPVIISDEDLDLEIEKIKSMKTQYNSPNKISSTPSGTSSPVKSAANSPSPIANPDSATQPIEILESSEEVSKPAEVTPIKKEPFEHCVVVTKSGEKAGKTNELIQNSTPKRGKGKKKQAKASKMMAQSGIINVEQELTVLKISIDKEKAMKNSAVKAEKKQSEDAQECVSPHKIHRKNSGRDSANHSPSDVMLASPSLSSMSDNHSEGSSDSGKGGSDLATPPPSRTPQLTNNSTVSVTYDFVISQHLVGKLIGKQGCFVQHVKDKSNARVFVNRHPTNNRLKLCTIEGTRTEIDNALKMIREKFPLKKYLEVTLEQVHLTPVIPTVSLIPDYLYLKLIEGINNDTILSYMVTPSHLFMQQPTHPTFPSLSQLTGYMNMCYSKQESPLLPYPIPENTVCSAFSMDSWCRVMVLSSDEETDSSYVKFLDYGGYGHVDNNNLRQIRQDFMLLPFQAAECILANVKSKREDGSWPDAAYSFVAEITKGSVIYTQVADYTSDGIPLVLCYVVPNHTELVFLNRRLVDAGFAEWIASEEDTEPTHLQPNEEEPIEVL